jgi:hypothetical protein
MKLFLGIVAALIIGGSLWADYKWRRWIGERRRPPRQE